MNWRVAGEIILVMAVPLFVAAGGVAAGRAGDAKPNPRRRVRSWFGDSARHADAARKGWTNRRRGYPRSWDEV